jgi:NAD(P)H-flavin reductase
LLVTGGLGCAPLVSVIHYAMRRRADFGHIAIVQGVKHGDDLIWRDRYAEWEACCDTQVLLAADVGGPEWKWHVGLVTDLLERVEQDVSRSLVMMCGPEGMMKASASRLLEMGCDASDMWLSMERNMQCATGVCGHCQYGPDFICRDGPVFPLARIQDRLGVKGF